ncbi:MAG: segregation/condensation protein A [Phycisphaeraceae bacterium]|nr:segregation/condensation protein A [Phycisphaeraceae bacterium]
MDQQPTDQSLTELSQSMDDYRVNLDCYSGPLDLLLFLVKRHEIDIYNLPMKELTEQYLLHVKLMEDKFNVDVAGEFLVVAATLLEVKSLMIMPAGEEGEQGDGSEDDGISESDPRYGLVQQLLAYKKFKDASRQLDEMREQWEKRFPAMPTRLTKADRKQLDGVDDALPKEIDLEDVNVIDLCEAFSKLLESIGSTSGTLGVTYDDTPIALHAEDIFDRLQRDGSMTLQKMFEGRSSRSEMIGLFMATLELVREHRVRVIQDQINHEIKLEVRPPDESQQDIEDSDKREWRNPETGEVDYEWPSEWDRKRAQRRAKLRATFAKKKELADLEDVELEDEEAEDESADEAVIAENQPSDQAVDQVIEEDDDEDEKD